MIETCDVPPPIKVSDKVQEEAIAYAGRSVNFTYKRIDGNIGSRLKRIANGIIMEKAFETYWLEKYEEVLRPSGNTHWREIDKVEYEIRGLKIDVKGAHIYRSYHGNNRVFPDDLITMDLLVPEDQVQSSGAPDIYVKSALVSEVDNGRYLVSTIMKDKFNNKSKSPYKVKIALSKKEGSNIYISINGEVRDSDTGEMNDATELIFLEKGRKEVVSEKRFISVQYLSLHNEKTYAYNTVKVELTIEALSEISRSVVKYTVKEYFWHQLWHASPVVYFLGWVSHSDLLNSEVLPAGSQHAFYSHTKVDNHAIPVSDINPMRSIR